MDWKQSIPYDETGVLIRPAGWTDDQIETALIDVMALRGYRPRTAHIDSATKASERLPLRQRLLRIPRGRHAVLTVILLLQAALSLRDTNTAFEDEALYLYSGHLELSHLMFGTPIPPFSQYFSGAPVLYPVVGAVADQIGGVFAARLLSLFFMLSATGLLYLTSRRLFGVRAALCAAALFSTTEAVVFVGGLATYDAPAVFLLALAGWIVVRSARSSWPFYLLAVFPLMLAVGTKYAALLFVPTVLVLAGLSALSAHGRWWAMLRPISLGLMFGAMLYGLLRLAGPDYAQGVKSTTTARAQGGTPTGQMLQEIAQWGGAVFAVSVLGAVLYVARPKPAHDAAPQPGWIGRALLACVLVGTALLAPANQLRLHTDVSLQKHIGFGLLFAAPFAGYGLVRLVGDRFHRLQLGIGVWALTFAFGASQSHAMFSEWTDSTKLIATLRHYAQPHGQYLVEVDEVPIYYLRGNTNAEPDQFTSTFVMSYTDIYGKAHQGDAAFAAAIHDDYFTVVAFNGQTTPQTDATILAALKSNHDYYLATTITGMSSAGKSTFSVWVKGRSG